MLVRWLLPAVAVVVLAMAVSAAGRGELAGTSWRLVEIGWMDDRSGIPDDPAKYTLELRTDGLAAMAADCNRGTSSWTSESAGKIAFGPVASTRAMCRPGSLSEEYLTQLGRVRSYVLKDHHLFLATMADGPILELEPHDPSPPAVTPGERSEP